MWLTVCMSVSPRIAVKLYVRTQRANGTRRSSQHSGQAPKLGIQMSQRSGAVKSKDALQALETQIVRIFWTDHQQWSFIGNTSDDVFETLADVVRYYSTPDTFGTTLQFPGTRTKLDVVNAGKVQQRLIEILTPEKWMVSDLSDSDCIRVVTASSVGTPTTHSPGVAT